MTALSKGIVLKADKNVYLNCAIVLLKLRTSLIKQKYGVDLKLVSWKC